MEHFRNFLKFSNPLGGDDEKVHKKKINNKERKVREIRGRENNYWFSFKHSYTIIIIDNHYKAPEEGRPKIHVH
jgi:hypothetical protein